MEKNSNKKKLKRRKGQESKQLLKSLGTSQQRGIELAELDRVAKMLVRRDFELSEIREKREKEIEELRKTKEELEETKTTLEIKVQARTKELKELAESLEEKVKKRTKELQKRIDELEMFHRLTVGRETRMVELKKEIERLKKEIDRLKEGTKEKTA